MSKPTDIVLCTKNRLPILKQMLGYLFERTTTPFRLYIIDDASTDGSAAYLAEQFTQGQLAGLKLRSRSEPISANWNTAPQMAQSDVMVFTDDDVLCPKLQPDWLEQGLKMMQQHRKLGMLALNNPTANAVHAIEIFRRAGPITICDRVGAHLALIRRELMNSIVIPPAGKKLGGVTVSADSKGLDRAWSNAIHERGYSVAYLTQVYCQHIGSRSIRNGRNLQARNVEPVDGDTLEPPVKFKG
jgi:hypothetical protein